MWIVDCGCGVQAPGRMDVLKRLMKDRRFHRLAGAGALMAAVLGLIAWKAGVDAHTLKAWWLVAEGWLTNHPGLLVLALVVLPGLPIPTSALMFFAGTVWRDQPLIACAVCMGTTALNLSWTYWVAAKPGRGLVERLLSNSSIRVPELPKGNQLRVILLLRLTPGVPLFIQNYLLGFLRVPFGLYLPVSLGCSGIIACGFVLSGAGVADGNLRPLISGVALIVLGFVVVQMLRQKLRGKS